MIDITYMSEFVRTAFAVVLRKTACAERSVKVDGSCNFDIETFHSSRKAENMVDLWVTTSTKNAERNGKSLKLS